MRASAFARWAAAGTLLVAFASCGEGLRGYAVEGYGFRVAATAVRARPGATGADSLFASADAVDWEIPLAGGCGGPYRVTVVAGRLPEGIGVADGEDPATGERRHHLRGVLLEDGAFRFRLEVLDTACDPFAAAHADLAWDVVRGRVAIVGAEPPLLAPGADVRDGRVRNPDHPALEGAVFGEFGVRRLLVAGGTPPHALEVVDDPADPGDGDLPLGVAIPPGSASIVGAPLEVGPGGEPFLITLRATDADGSSSAPFRVRWDVVTPPIALAPGPLPDGTAGEPYAASPAVAGGVPPLRFEVADGTGRSSAASYPSPDDPGPDYRALSVPPEGLFLGDVVGHPLSGTLSGTPRRRGTFRFRIRVVSAVLPDVPGQRAERDYEMSVAPSAPLVLRVPPSLPEAEAGAPYDPDAATHSRPGLLLRAEGGVRKDGLTDAPHLSEAVPIDGLGPEQEDAATPGGGYDWTVAPDPPPGVALDGWTGVWRVADASRLVPQRAREVALTASDQALPTGARNVATARATFAVGPDTLVLTESTTPGTTTTGASWWDMNDNAQTVRVGLPYAARAPVVRDLAPGDLSRTHAVPATAGLSGDGALATLLTKVDLMRVCVNPSGWWDDLHGLNPNGARPGQHADRNAVDRYLAGESDLGPTSDQSRQPSATCVDLPSYRPSVFDAVVHDPARGVHADGGRLHAFANDSFFGAFVVRSDASIYVPFAFSRTAAVGGRTYGGLGDGVAIPHAATGRSQLRVPHLAVSPDGRFGAMKLKTRETDYGETAATTPVVLFSLTGEKPFEGRTWSLVESGSDGTPAVGVLLHAASLTLTDSHLYWLCGNRTGALSAAREHFVYRFRFADPATGRVVAGASGTGTLLGKADPVETRWTNAPGSPLQTRFQLSASPLASGYAHAAFLHLDGGNLLENSLAPLPFRASADGRSLAILAMPDQASGADQQAWHVWVDFEGRGVRRLSAAPLHVTGGATRGYALARGANVGTYENWHRWGGPTPQMEISDDGTCVAVVANRFAGTPTTSAPTTTWPSAREDVVAWRTEDRVRWREVPVTGDGAGTNVFSDQGSPIWRFGSLVFTEDGAGLVFWGGFSCWHAAGTSSAVQYSSLQSGTLYGTDLSSATGIGDVRVTSLLPTSEGGSSDGVRAYTAASPCAPPLPALAYSAVAGVLKPYGGFLSRNRRFAYWVNKGGLSSGSADYRLVAANVRSADPSRSVNGRADFRAFAVGGWPSRRGFLSGTYQHYAYYGLFLTDYPAYRKWGMGLQVTARGSGRVLWGSHHQSAGPAVGTASSLYGGPLLPTYSYDYASYGGEVECFDADVGGDVRRLSAFGADTGLRRIHFLEATDDGDAVAFVHDVHGTANGSPASEVLHAVRAVATDASGRLTSAPERFAVETEPGRISDAVAWGTAHDRLYYGAGDASNENAMVLKEAVLAAGGVRRRVLSSVRRRWNVLGAGR